MSRPALTARCLRCHGTGVEHYTVEGIAGAQPCPDCTPEQPRVSKVAQVLKERKEARA